MGSHGMADNHWFTCSQECFLQCHGLCVPGFNSLGDGCFTMQAVAPSAVTEPAEDLCF